MGSSKHDERAFPAGTENERTTRKLLGVFERLAREAQDDIAYAYWQSARRGLNVYDAIAGALQHLSRDRMFMRGMLARYLERAGLAAPDTLSDGAFLTSRERLAVYALVAPDAPRAMLVQVLGPDAAGELLHRLGVTAEGSPEASSPRPGRCEWCGGQTEGAGQAAGVCARCGGRMV